MPSTILIPSDNPFFEIKESFTKKYSLSLPSEELLKYMGLYLQAREEDFFDFVTENSKTYLIKAPELERKQLEAKNAEIDAEVNKERELLNIKRRGFTTGHHSVEIALLWLEKSTDEREKDPSWDLTAFGDILDYAYTLDYLTKEEANCFAEMPIKEQRFITHGEIIEYIKRTKHVDLSTYNYRNLTADQMLEAWLKKKKGEI